MDTTPANLYELSEIVDKRFSHGEEIPQNIIESIRTAVVQAFEAPYNPDLYNRIISNYTWEDTARQTLTGYESIFSATE